jgi:hypothetical protein
VEKPAVPVGSSGFRKHRFQGAAPYLAESVLSESNEPLYDSAWKPAMLSPT